MNSNSTIEQAKQDICEQLVALMCNTTTPMRLLADIVVRTQEDYDEAARIAADQNKVLASRLANRRRPAPVP